MASVVSEVDQDLQEAIDPQEEATEEARKRTFQESQQLSLSHLPLSEQRMLEVLIRTA